MIHVRAWSIPEAWHRSVRTVLEEGDNFSVGRGSETTVTRKVAACLEVLNPGNRPLVHEKAPTDEDYLNEYLLGYLYSGEKGEGERYTYGERMRSAATRDGGTVDQLGSVIERLIEEPMDRQCTVTLRYPGDIYSDDPPCLTVLDVEVEPLRPENQATLDGFSKGHPGFDSSHEGRLNFYAYFRSWDVYAGLPTNLGGLQLLKEWMAERVGADDGRLSAFCKNLHLYERQFPAARALGSDRVKSFYEHISEA